MSGDYFVFPASPSQRALLFLERVSPGSASYHVAYGLEIDGEVDLTRLRQALRACVEQHESLRTTFREHEGVIAQFVDEAVDAYVDVDRVAVETDAIEHAARLAAAPFDLARGPLLRVRLIQGASRSVLSIVLHHAIADAASLDVLVEDLLLAYGRLSAGEPAGVEPPSLQFGDWCMWAAERATPERTESLLSEIARGLEGAPARSVFPATTTGGSPTRGVQVRLVPPDIDHQRVEAVARKHGVTPFAVYLAAFAIHLARASGHDDVVIGAPMSNRVHAELARTIGFLVGTHPLRLDLRSEVSCSDVIRRVHGAMVRATELSEVPLESIVERLKPPRVGTENPLFQTLFAYHPGVADQVAIPGALLRPVPLDLGVAKFDCMLFVEPIAGSGVRLVVEVDTSRHEDGFAERVAARFGHVIARVIEDPSAPWRSLALGARASDEPAANGGPVAALLDALAIGATDVIEGEGDVAQSMATAAAIRPGGARRTVAVGGVAYWRTRLSAAPPTAPDDAVIVSSRIPVGLSRAMSRLSSRTWALAPLPSEGAWALRALQGAEPSEPTLLGRLLAAPGVVPRDRWGNEAVIDVAARVAGVDVRIRQDGALVRMVPHPHGGWEVGDPVESARRTLEALPGVEEAWVASDREEVILECSAPPPAVALAATLDLLAGDRWKVGHARALPRQSDGTLDRAAADSLIAWMPVAPGAEDASLLPRVVEAFEATLSRRVGPDEDFFALGGHSMSAIQLARRVGAVVERDVPIAAIFAAPSPRRLLARLLRASPDLNKLRRRPAATERGASFFQERALVLTALGEPDDAYRISAAVRIEGSVDEAALQLAARRLVRRHASLRTELDREGERVVQRIRGHAETPWRSVVVETDDLVDAAVRDAAQEVTTSRPMALSLVRGGALAKLRVDVHHAFVDAQSLTILLAELDSLYSACLGASAGALALPALEFADWAEWHRDIVTAQREEMSGFWRGELAGAPLVVELGGGETPRRDAPRGRGATRRIELPRALRDAVEHRARQLGVTVPEVLIFAVGFLVTRVAHTSEVLIGVPTSLRTASELEGVVGCFVNLIPARVRPAPGRPLGAAVTDVSATLRRAAAHADMPFEELVRLLQPPRELGRNPVVQVVVNVHEAPGECDATASRRLVPEALPDETTKVDLMFATRRASWHVLDVEYATDVLDAHQIDALGAGLETVLRALAETPDATVGAVAPFGARSETPRDPPRVVDVAQAFLEAARRAPERTALEGPGDGGSLSYGDLADSSLRFAAGLSALVPRGASVGVIAARGAELLVAVLGSLIAQCPYVPVARGMPEARVRAMLDDAGVGRVVVDEAGVSSVAGRPATTIRSLLQTSALATPTDASPDDATAYVLFTSGSTGRPKGVAVPRGALARVSGAVQELLDIRSDDVVAFCAAPTFDISAVEMFLPLAVGARIVVISEEEARDGERMARRLDAIGASVLQATPTTWRMLAMAGWRGRLRRALVGGEPLTADVARYILERAEVAHNGYGPTEATVYATFHRFLAASEASIIGAPLASAAAVVVDQEGHELPRGFVGELWIRGPALADGYVGRARETALRFVPDERGVPGSRAYRTGDFARVDQEGRLVFCGRRDHQVKVRGHRVELGEIEVELRAVRGVADAVVSVVKHGDTDALVAYTVADGGDPSATEPEHLRAALARRLPAVMVPSVFVRMDSIPLTASGKVDRNALPAPPFAVPVEVPDGDEIAAQVRRAWCSELGSVGPGPHDDFFALGGHSLTALATCRRLGEALGVDVPVRLLFHEPTFARFTEEIRQLVRGPVEPLVAGSASAGLTDAELRVWLASELGDGAAYVIPVAALVRGRTTASIIAALQELVARHDALRSRFLSSDAGPIRVVDAPGPLDVTEVDARAATDPRAEAREIADSLARTPFDLGAERLVRASIIRVTDDAAVVALVVHHIACDAWSLGILARELLALLQRRELAPAPSIVDLAAHLARPEVTARRALLADEVAGVLQKVGAPSARIEPHAGDSYQAAGVLDGAMTRALRAVVTRRRSTMFAVAVAAYCLALAETSARPKLRCGTAIAWRPRSTDDTLVGCLVQTIPMWVDLEGAQTVEDALQVSATAARAAVEHAAAPLELVDAAARSRGTEGPLVDHMIVLHPPSNFGGAAAEQGFEDFPLSSPPPKFPTVLMLSEHDDDVHYRISAGADGASLCVRFLKWMDLIARGELDHGVERPRSPDVGAFLSPLEADE